MAETPACSPKLSPWSDVSPATLLEETALIELVVQASKLLVEVGDAVVISIGGKRQVLPRDTILSTSANTGSVRLVGVSRLGPETAEPSRRQSDKGHARRYSSKRRETAAPAAFAARASRGTRD